MKKKKKTFLNYVKMILRTIYTKLYSAKHKIKVLNETIYMRKKSFMNGLHN